MSTLNSLNSFEGILPTAINNVVSVKTFAALIRPIRSSGTGSSWTRINTNTHVQILLAGRRKWRCFPCRSRCEVESGDTAGGSRRSDGGWYGRSILRKSTLRGRSVRTCSGSAPTVTDTSADFHSLSAINLGAEGSWQSQVSVRCTAVSESWSGHLGHAPVGWSWCRIFFAGRRCGSVFSSLLLCTPGVLKKVRYCARNTASLYFLLALEWSDWSREKKLCLREFLLLTLRQIMSSRLAAKFASGVLAARN